MMTRREIRDWYRAAPGYWFRPKLFGWGAVPVTWQGWLATLGLVVLALPVAWLIETRGLWFAAPLGPLVAGFVWLYWAKTDGDWKWRWGTTR
jgi:hypothetical protein